MSGPFSSRRACAGGWKQGAPTARAAESNALCQCSMPMLYADEQPLIAVAANLIAILYRKRRTEKSPDTNGTVGSQVILGALFK